MESFINEPALGEICKHAILLYDYLDFSFTAKVPERGKISGLKSIRGALESWLWSADKLQGVEPEALKRRRTFPFL